MRAFFQSLMKHRENAEAARRLQETEERLRCCQEALQRSETQEQEISRNEAMYRAIFENTGSASILIDSDTTILLANTEWHRVTGFTPEDVERKMSWTAFVVEEDLDRMLGYHYARRAKDGQAPNDYEFRMRTREGQIRDIVLRVAMIPGTAISIASLHDVTARKIAEEKFRLAFHCAPIPMTVAEAGSGPYVEVNDAGVAFSGYSRQELIGHNWVELGLIGSPEKEEIPKRIRRDGSIRNMEVNFRIKSGEVRKTILNAELVDIGDKTHVLATVLDITERIIFLKALQASEEKYRSLFAHTPAGVLHYNCQLVITDCNDRFAEILESSYERLIGLDMHKLKDQVALNCFSKAIQGQEGFYEGLYRTTTSNAEKWLYIHTAPLYSADGSLNGGIGIIEDISPRRELEKERDQLRNFLGNILDSMPSILIGIDGQRKVTSWNRAARLQTGLSEFEVLGREVEEALPVVRKLRSRIDRALAGRVIQYEERLPYTEKGEPRYAEAMIYPLSSQDMPGAVIRLDDITEKVHMEEIMIQTEKMMSVGGMAAGMAHEINNPLGGILQGAQNVLRRLEVDSAPNQQAAAEAGTSIEAVRAYAEGRQIVAFIEGIRSSGIRASNIVSNMLQFSRGSSRKHELAPLARLLDNTIELASSDYDLNKSYDFRHIEIVRDYADDLPDIPCSPVEIEQVVLNLLKNAAQALAGQEKPPVISLHTRREKDWAVLEVADNGPGMPEAVRRRIFEPFYTTKPAGGGTGLGLAVSYFIITNNHRGQIFVETVPGEGTVFTIRLPITREPGPLP